MASALMRRLEKAEPIAQVASGEVESVVYGVVDKVIDGEPNIVRRWKGTIGNMEATEEAPTILLLKNWNQQFLGIRNTNAFMVVELEPSRDLPWMPWLAR